MGCTAPKAGKGASAQDLGANAVILKLSEFMQGPLGGNALMNEMGLMQKKIDFTGTISKIGINKLFKRVSSSIHQTKQLPVKYISKRISWLQMRFKVQVMIEELIDELPMNPGEQNRRKVYRPIEDSRLNN